MRFVQIETLPAGKALVDIDKQNPGGTTTGDLSHEPDGGEDPTEAEEAEEMEKVQKDAAEERENEGGYQ